MIGFLNFDEYKNILRKKLKEVVDFVIWKFVEHTQLDLKFLDFDNILTLSVRSKFVCRLRKN